MNVYMVNMLSVFGDEDGVEAIFASRELAEAYVAKLKEARGDPATDENADDYSIEEWHVHDTVPEVESWFEE